MAGQSRTKASIDLVDIISLNFNPPLLLDSEQAAVEAYLSSNAIRYQTEHFATGATEIDCGGIRYKFRFDEDNNYAIGISRNEMPFPLINWPNSLGDFNNYCVKNEISHKRQNLSRHSVVFNIQDRVYFYFEDTHDQAMETDFELTFIEIMRRPKAGFPLLASPGRE